MSLSRVAYWKDYAASRFEATEADRKQGPHLIDEIRTAAGMESSVASERSDDLTRAADAVVYALSFSYDAPSDAFQIVSDVAQIDLAGSDLAEAVRLGEAGDRDGLVKMLDDILDQSRG